MLRIILSVIFSLLLLSSCTPKIDQRKFEEVYRAAKDIEGKIELGVNYQEFEDLIKKLSSEIKIAEGILVTEEEKELLKMYSEILSLYIDSHKLWKSKMHSTHHKDYKGRPLGIKLDGELINIANKYGFKITTPLDIPGSGAPKFIDNNSIEVLWEQARHLSENATLIYSGNIH